jgi:hypothetical protein
MWVIRTPALPGTDNVMAVIACAAADVIWSTRPPPELALPEGSWAETRLDLARRLRNTFLTGGAA